MLLSAPALTFVGNYAEFRKVAGEFFQLVDSVKFMEELQAAYGCLALHYLGIEWDENDPFTSCNRESGAPAIIRIATRKYLENELRLERLSTV